jgi:uncharacterized protein
MEKPAPMSLKDLLNQDMIAALKQRDTVALGAIRLVRSRIKELEIEKRRELAEEEISDAVVAAIRRRHEAIEQFRRGNRMDLVAKEEREIQVLQKYAPTPLGADEIAALVDEAIRETGASQPGDLGKVMGKLMPKVRGKADGTEINRLVRERLGASGS